MTRSEWIALAKRCEEAKGPDRELDFAIGIASGVYTEAGPCPGHRQEGDKTRYVTYLHPKHKTIWRGAIGACVSYLTGSLDAITSLIEDRFTPNWTVERNCGGTDAQIWDVGGSSVASNGHTPALALCAAFCRAMAERTEA